MNEYPLWIHLFSQSIFFFIDDFHNYYQNWRQHIHLVRNVIDSQRVEYPPKYFKMKQTFKKELTYVEFGAIPGLQQSRGILADVFCLLPDQ